jgi:DNA-binding IclR family transcriptional regulator
MSISIPPSEAAGASRVAAVDRALALLQVFTVDEPQLTLSELALRAGQHKSTTLRLLASLEFAGLVRRRADGRFTLGAAVPRLHAVFGRAFSLRDAVRPTLEALVAQTRESASFHVDEGGRDLCLERLDSPQAVRDHGQAGDLQPLSAGIGGRLLRAFAGARGGGAARIRRERLLIADGDVVPEVAGVAAPVWGADGRIAGALVLTMPAMRLQRSHAATVRRAARELTLQMGGSEPPIRANPR